MNRIQFEIQFQHVHPRFTEKSELASLRYAFELWSARLVHSCRVPSPPAESEIPRPPAKYRIEARGGRSYQVRWDRRAGVCRLELLHAGIYPVAQGFVRRSQV